MEFYAFAGAILLAAAPAQAQLLLYDFEDATETFSSPSDPVRLGALMSLTVEGFVGIPITVTRPGDVFDVVLDKADQGGNTGGIDLVFSRSLDPFASTAATPFVIDFPFAFSHVAVAMGDEDGDTDTLRLEAFSEPGAKGTLLGTATGILPGSTTPRFSREILLVGQLQSPPTIRSIRMIGGSAEFPNSVYYDALVLGSPEPPPPAPEPSSLALLTLGSLGLAAARLRRRGRAV